MNAIQSRKARDVGLKCISACGNFRIIAATTTDIVRQAMKVHNFPALKQENPVKQESSGSGRLPYYHAEQAELLATSITWTNIMSSTLRDEERFSVRVHTPDFLGGSPNVEAMALGECRASFSALHSAETNPKHEEISEETPHSFTTVANRVMYNHSKPVTSATGCLVNSRRGMGNFTPHAQHFLTQSEGVPSAVLLLTCYDYVKQQVAWSGGVMVQAIAPGASTSSTSTSQGEDEEEEGDEEAEPLSEEAKLLQIIEHRQAVFDTMWWEPQLKVVGDATGLNSQLRPTDSKLLEDLHHRHVNGGLLMHDLLSLATFSPEGVKEVCAQNRLNVPPLTHEAGGHQSATAAAPTASVSPPAPPVSCLSTCADELQPAEPAGRSVAGAPCAHPSISCAAAAPTCCRSAARSLCVTCEERCCEERLEGLFWLDIRA